MSSNLTAIAQRLARVIFEAGDQPHDKVQRIEFRGGSYPDRETSLGGMNQAALATEIEMELERMSLMARKVDELAKQQAPGGT